MGDKVRYLIAAGVLVSAAALSACNGKSGNASAPVEAQQKLDAKGIADQLKAAGLPIKDVSVVTAESDDNHLLGRPGQYSSKIFFYDARHPKQAPDSDENENTIEVFENEADAKTRHDYIEEVTKGTPFLMQYLLLQGKVLLRLDKIVLPKEADQYKTALAKLD